MSKKRYPEEFKIEATNQGVDRGHSISDVAKRLDVALATRLIQPPLSLTKRFVILIWS